MRSQAPKDIHISTDHLLLTKSPVAQAAMWQSLTPSLKKLMGVIQLWLDMDPPKSVVPTALALKGVQFDHIAIVQLGKIPVVRVGSHLTAHLAGCSMGGRSISDAPNAKWMGSILDQLQAVRSARNLVYRVDHELVDGHFSNVHRLVIPLSSDGRVIDEFVVASQVVPAQ
jgi:hypothetical protein